MMATETLRSSRPRSLLIKMALTVGLVLAGLTVSTPAFAEEPKIGYVDLQRALNEVEEGKKAKKRLEKEYKKKQKKLNKKQKEVKKLKQELKSGQMMMSKDAQRQKMMEYQKKLAELQQIYMEEQRELAKKEAAETKKIFDKMGKIVDKIAEEKGYDLILEKSESSVLYARDGMDLTDELIERYDNQ